MLDDEKEKKKKREEEEKVEHKDEECHGCEIETHVKITLNNEERTECEVWTRVMGYHRPVSSFNIGKKGEFEERKFFCEGKTKNVEQKKKTPKKKKGE